jgi:hypothetical protein
MSIIVFDGKTFPGKKIIIVPDNQKIFISGILKNNGLVS